MAIQLKSKPGITGATALSIPQDWDAVWFRNFINNLLKGSDVRNAVGANGISVTGSIASPYATIGFAAPVTLPGPVVINRTGDGDSIILQRSGVSQLYMGFGDAFNAGQSEIFSTNSAPLGIGTLGAQAINFYTASLSRMTIAGTGAVTINTPTSGNALVMTGIAGTNTMVINSAGTNVVQVVSTVPSADVSLHLDISATDAFYFGSNHSGSTNGIGALTSTNYIYTNQGVPIVIGTASTARLTVGGGGNVTINKPATGVALTINVNGVNGQVLVLSTTVARGSGQDNVLFTDPTGTKGQFGYSGADDTFYVSNEIAAPMILRTNGTARLTLGSTGGVVVASNSATTCFTVNNTTATPNTSFTTAAARGTGQCNVLFNDPTGLKAQFGYAGGDDTFYISNELASQMILRTSGIGRLNIAATGAVSIIGNFGINNVGAPAQITGWGTPTTPTVVANFSGAAATLVNCSNAIAKIITDLKAYGFYGA